MLVGGGEYNNTGSRRTWSLQLWEESLCRRPVFVALGGAYEHRPPAQVAGPSCHTPRGVAAGEGPACYLVPVAKRPECVTRVRAA
jgi:hypothetical protein